MNKDYLKRLKSGTEEILGKIETPWPKSKKELDSIISALVQRKHNYGTCVYGVALSAVATFNYMAHMLGITGFQAGCADMVILGHTRNWRWGRIQNYENLLYPQYCDEEHFPRWQTIIQKNREEFRKRAEELIAKSDDHVAPGVLAYWRELASEKIFG